MINHYLFPLLAFIPGSVLLYLFSSKHNIKLSSLEIMILGSVIWNYVLVSCGYMVGIFSDLIGEFFIIFTLSSLLLLIYGGYRLLIRKQHSGISFKINSHKILLLISSTPLLLIILTLTISHSIFIEYDAIFLYLPYAKSIVETGGLQYALYHQTSLLTTLSPAMPIIYAWLRYFCGNWMDFILAVRIIPFVYIILTGTSVYLISKQLSNNSTIATIAFLCFLSIPVTSAIASNYSLYLDIPFTFLLTLNLLIFLKIFLKHGDNKFWYLMLGITSSFMLLIKDMSALILPALIAILLVPALPQFDKKLRVLLILMLSILFTGAYNFFFVWDLCHFPTNMITGFIIRQLPIFVVVIIFSFMLYDLSRHEREIINKSSLLYFFLPLIPAVVYFLRNLFSFGAVSSSLFLFNADFKAAMKLIIEARGVVKHLPTNIHEPLRWDILFTSFNLGAILLIPAVLGLFTVFYNFKSKPILRKKSFILLSFFLILLSLWSWIFYCSCQGSELRRLYYFAPLLAIFAAIGIQTTIKHTKSRNIVPRFIMFNSFVFAYLWALRFNISSSNIEQLRSTLLSLKIADMETLLVFAFFFLLSFYPFNINFQKISIKKHMKTISRVVRLMIPLTLIILVSSLILPFSFATLSNSQENITYVPPHWENDLYEVISYINHEVKDNYTIVTCYALPIAYFTNHPVIEVCRYDGLITLLKLNESSPKLIDTLREQNIAYLLFPKPAHSHYDYFIKLSNNLPILSTEFISKTPHILLLKEFSKFKLYKVITTWEAQYHYSYLTLFEKDWNPLNNYSEILHLTKGIAVRSTGYDLKVIVDDNQDTFWEAAKADPKDEIILSNDFEIKTTGKSSLKIHVNGTRNMVIRHTYKTAQNWESFSNLNIFFYGANTTKSIMFTFHTTPWQDYYAKSIKDDFIGWKKISLPLDSFSIHGKPSWSNITYIEILLGGRIATYYMDQISLEGYSVGLEGSLPPISANSSQLKIVISVQGYNLQLPAKVKLTSSHGQLVQTLDDGVNLITVPSGLLKEGAKLTIFYPQSSSEQELCLYYLGILSN